MKFSPGDKVKLIPCLRNDKRFGHNAGEVVEPWIRYGHENGDQTYVVQFDREGVPFKYKFREDELIRHLPEHEKNEKLCLTEAGKFSMMHGVLVSPELWKTIIDKAKTLLDGADKSEENVDNWRIFLQELHKGCEVLMTEDNLYRMMKEDGNE